MIRNCYSLLNDDKIITDSFGNAVAKKNLISLKDAEALKEAVSFSLEKTPKSAKKAGFSSVSETLDDIITTLTKTVER